MRLDRLTTEYSGCARTERVRVSFDTLARAAAAGLLPRLAEKCEGLQATRPLLPFERDYLRCISDLSNMFQYG